MSIILQTESVLSVEESGDFNLVTSYSGEVNPIITYEATITIQDNSGTPIEDANVNVNSIDYTSNSIGQVVVELPRGSFTVIVSKEGYDSITDNVTIVDGNVSKTITIGSIGSFDQSYDEGFE